MWNRKKLVILLFIALALIQLYVPVSMIVQHELALRYGQEFKFKAVPVDPYDPFRGRYVSIRIDGMEATVSKDDGFRPRQTVYALVEKDPQGFAKVTGISPTVPADSVYFKTKILYYNEEAGGKQKVFLDTPFDRYYMEEKLAPEAEIQESQSSYDNPGSNNIVKIPRPLMVSCFMPVIAPSAV